MERRFAGEHVRLPRDREPSRADPAPAEIMLRLAGAIGNRAFSAVAARHAAGTVAREEQKEEYLVRFGHVLIRADTAPEQAEANVLVDRLRSEYGVTLDSASSIEKLRDKYRQKHGRTAPTGDAASFEALLEATIRGEAWRLDELRAMVSALDAPLLPGGRARVRHLRHFVLGGADIGIPKAAEAPVSQWSFGRTTGTMQASGAGWTADPGTQAETVAETGRATISLTGELTTQGTEIPDTNPVAQARANIVHELAHTFPTSWVNLFSHNFKQDSGTQRHEVPPTEYAKENYTEDFCDSFMLFTLYPGTLQQKCPARFKWFENFVGALDAKLEQALEDADERLAPAAAPAAPIS